MILRVLIFASILLAACSPAPVAPPDPPKPATAPIRAEAYPGNTQPLPPEPEPTAETPVFTPSQNTHSLAFRRIDAAGTTITIIAFDVRTHTLSIFDQANGPATEVETASQAGRQQRALAAINGGFFTPEGKPLGLVIENGQRIGSVNTASSLGSGFVYTEQQNPEPAIVRREVFQNRLNDPAFQPQHALQTGPFLVENGRAVSGLTNKEPRVRSLLLSDGQYHFALAQSEPVTLSNLAKALATQPIKGFRIQTALNLDGGRSAELYISSKIPNGPASLRRWWNKPVRNYVLLHKQ